MNCRIQDVRQHLSFLCLLAAVHSPADLSLGTLGAARNLAERLQNGSLVYYGWHYQWPAQRGGVGTLSDAARRNAGDFEMLKELAARGLYLDNCAAIRIGRGVSVLPAVQGFVHSLTLWWPEDDDEAIHTYEGDCNQD